MPFPALRLLARSLTFKGHNILSVLLTLYDIIHEKN